MSSPGLCGGQLEVLEERVEQRRAVFERYREAFADLPGIEPQPEIRGQRSEVGDQRSEDGGQGAEGRGQRSEVSTQPAEPQSSSAALSTINSQPSTSQSRHTRWLSCFLVDPETFGMSAADLIRFLDAANVEARPVWKPLHTQPLYKECEVIGGAVAEYLHRRGICLPSSSSLSTEDQQFVIDRVREAARVHA